jgi:hypothetical protein
MTYEEYKKELDRTGLMRFWKKAPVVEAVNKDGEVVKVEEKKEDGERGYWTFWWNRFGVDTCIT